MENLPKFKFKKDAYMRKRGAPAMLTILCSHCKNYIMSYQKDGPGPLLRCYLDRIHYPENLKNRQFIKFNKQSASRLECEACKIVIGTPIIYEKENRPAYHMRHEFFIIKKTE
jgi:hypothetical protein